MDDIVKAALAKWPNVPHCTGWLLLDRRGQWRMRDEACQAQGGLGTPIRHEALIGFINRNYAADALGQWYFQNGPQRVYVELAYTPWVVRLAADDTGVLALTDQAGGRFEPASVWVDEEGSILFAEADGGRIALLHDHDLDLFASHAALSDDGTRGEMRWRADRTLTLDALERETVASRFGFVASPAAAQAT